MPKLILVTVGTSALERCRNPKDYPDLDQLVDKLNKKGDSSQLYNNIKVQVAERLQRNIKRYLGGRDPDYRRLSAEIASLLAMHENQKIGEITGEDKIVLLYSETTDGKLCAEVNEKVICELPPYANVIIKPLVGIRVQPITPEEDIRKTFVTSGLNSLQNEVRQAVKSFREQYGRDMPCYMNITGGYKGTLPFTTVFALNYNLTLVYLYEKSEKIIWIKPCYLRGHINNPDDDMSDDELVPMPGG